MSADDARALVPATGGLPKLREAAASCRACELWADATQTVFGDGTSTARVMLVGEQPGDREDREGAAFVGPAGQRLDDALEAAGIDRRAVYVTNAVKHFRFEERGKRRIHQKPAKVHVDACRPWLDAELAAVRPDVLVLLGATAVTALLGSEVRVTKDRGKVLETALARQTVVTAHPSVILRAPDADARRAAFDALVADLRVVAGLLS
jgi:uracil-DNA glycosylase